MALAQATSLLRNFDHWRNPISRTEAEAIDLSSSAANRNQDILSRLAFYPVWALGGPTLRHL